MRITKNWKGVRAEIDDILNWDNERMRIKLNSQFRHYANGTYLQYTMPWSLYVGAAALCPDGKVRKVKRIAETPDTFYSIPASITYKGKTVAGYVHLHNVGDPSDPLAFEDAVVFTPYLYRKNGNIFNMEK
jgi:hypothetical protein